MEAVFLEPLDGFLLLLPFTQTDARKESASVGEVIICDERPARQVRLLS